MHDRDLVIVIGMWFGLVVLPEMVFGALRIKTKTAALVATKGTFPYAFDGSDGDDRDTKRTSQKKITRLYSFTPFSLHVMLNKVKKIVIYL